MVMVQPKVTPIEQATYDVLGVGQVVEIQEGSSIPDDMVPVHVAAVEQMAGSQLAVGQVVLWPKLHLAVPSAGSKPKDPKIPSVKEDRLRNYALQCLQLGVLLMQLNDTEKEGDGERCIMNWKLLMLYFRARARGTKYAFEAMRLITCVKALFTKKMAHQIVHGQFVNLRGGPGNNLANDLRMEMEIKDDKAILKKMCGNKTLKAVNRGTSSTYGMKLTSDLIDKESGVSPDSTTHTHKCTKETVEEMITILQEKRPFQHQEGRTLKSFPNISRSPLDQLDVIALHEWLSRNKRKLAVNAFERCEDNELSDEDDDECDAGNNDDDNDGNDRGDSEEESDVLYNSDDDADLNMLE